MAYQSFTSSQVISAVGFAVGVGETTTAYTPTIVADSSGSLYQAGTLITATAAQLNLLGSSATTASRRNIVTLVIPLTAGIASAKCAGIINPEGKIIMIVGAYLSITTAATASSATVDFGIASTNADASTFMSAQAVGSIALVAGTGVPVVCPAAYYITVFATATAATTGMVGNAYIQYWVP
jgi:hypothetical protein